MTLSVAYDKFADTLKKMGMSKEAFIAETDGRIIVAAYSAERQCFVSCESTKSKAETLSDLEKSGFTVIECRWDAGTPAEPSDDATPQFVAAVAYKAKGQQVGVWVDAFPYQPTQAQVLHAIYDEFKMHGEVGELGFEAFVRLANPTVAVISSPELSGFSRKHKTPSKA